MRQKIRKSVGAFSRGQLLRTDNSVPILFREDTIDPFTIGTCCVDESGTGSGCIGTSGVSFGYCCSVQGDFTPGVTLQGDPGSTGFTCCPEPPSDPVGQCCGQCGTTDKFGRDLGLKTESDCIAGGGVWRGVNGVCDDCLVRCCSPCPGFESIKGECSQVEDRNDCPDGAESTFDASCNGDQGCAEECPPDGSGCCCFINEFGDVVSETILDSNGNNICNARDGIFTVGQECANVDCTIFNVCCECIDSGCLVGEGQGDQGGNQTGQTVCTVELTPFVTCGPVLTNGECLSTAIDPHISGGNDCTNCGTLTDPTRPGPCGCPCADVTQVDIDSACRNVFPPICNSCDTCAINVVVGTVPGCDGGLFECGCVDTTGADFECRPG